MEQELINALEQGATVVTANQRLARHLSMRYAAVQQGRGAQVWETPDVLPWPAWLARSWASWFEGMLNTDVCPVNLLTPEQEQVLWEAVIRECERDHALLNVSAAAGLARDAWNLWHAWRLPLKSGGPHTPDTQAFLKWAAVFAAHCKAKQLLDSARLADAVADGFAAGRLIIPAKLLLAGFDELTPQQKAVLDVLWDARCDAIVTDPPARSSGQAVRVGAPDLEQEVWLAARWARARLEDDPDAQIGVIVPELGQVRDRIARIFEDTFHPDAVSPAAARSARAYTISLGLPLRNYPVIHTALNVLDLSRDSIALAQAGNLLRSPFLGGGEAEMSRRALLDSRLREVGELEIDLRLLARFAEAKDRDGNPWHYACPYLAEMLRAFERVLETLPARQVPSAWAESFNQLLTALGWPGERTLNSNEYQTVQAWRDALRDFGSLDRVMPQVTLPEALARLRRITATQFQPESPEAPVQVLGILEASGASFDYLWVMGMHDEAWPRAARPNPMLPIALQRGHNVPHACAQRELDYACRVTQRLLKSAPETVASYPTHEGDRDLHPSPLIAMLDEVQTQELRVYSGETWAIAIYRSADIEMLPDDSGPALEHSQAPGGTRLLEDQAACPFRGFATHRLGARALREPGLGLDPSARGALVHDALEKIWSKLKTHERLCTITAAHLQAIVTAAVEQTIDRVRHLRGRSRSDRFFLIEQERLEQLLLAWLELEKQRAPFKIAALEQEQIAEISGLRLRTRVDRIDELVVSHRPIIIDYKTGAPKLPAWFDDRLEQPQLPLYSVYLQGEQRPAAIVLAHVRQGEMKYQGIVEHDGLVPDLKAFMNTKSGGDCSSWDSIFSSWKAAIDQLAAEIRAGRAVVDPKNYPETCRYCPLPALCRMHEIFAGWSTAPEDEHDEFGPDR